MRIPGFIDRRTILRGRRLWLHYGVFWLGAVATGLVAVMYARLIDFGYDTFLRFTAVCWWLPLVITPAIGAFGVWMTILRKSTLSAAFTTSAIVFVAVMFASWLVSANASDSGSWWAARSSLAASWPSARMTPNPAQVKLRNLHLRRISENSMSAVQDTVFGIIAKEAGIDIATIKPDSTLKDLNIQSLDAVQIIFEIEDHYKITLPDRDPNFDTESVKGLIDAVEKLVAEKTAAPSAG